MSTGKFENNWIKIQKYCEIVGRSERAIREYCSSGKFHYIVGRMAGGRWQFNRKIAETYGLVLTTDPDFKNIIKPFLPSI